MDRAPLIYIANQEKEEDFNVTDNIIDFKKPKLAVDNGGNAPNWLAGLEIGTAFLCQPKRQEDFSLPHFIKIGSTDSGKGAWLKPITRQDQEPIPVDTVRFTTFFNLYEITGIIREEEQSSEEEDKEGSTEVVSDEIVIKEDSNGESK